MSQAIVIRWNGIGVLLGGDVIHHKNDVERGWRGVLRVLEQREQMSLLKNLQFIKIAHHGSTSAFCEDAWKIHAQDKPVKIAGMTPCTKGGRGKNPPPQTEIFPRLFVHAESLALTSLPHDPEFARVVRGGWKEANKSTSGDASCFKVTLQANEAVDVELSGTARQFVRASPT